MFQPDLFNMQAGAEPALLQDEQPLDLPAVLERLTLVCERPRYSFMVLNLLAQACSATGKAGPYVSVGERRVPIRDWLCDALAPVAQRDPRRRGIERRVRASLEQSNAMPADELEAKTLIEAQVRRRIRLSGRTNVSRAVSELVRAGLVRRYYQGYRVDHENRGAQRQAVYSVTAEARQALRSS
jgi:hypothetical protein